MSSSTRTAILDASELDTIAGNRLLPSEQISTENLVKETQETEGVAGEKISPD